MAFLPKRAALFGVAILLIAAMPLAPRPAAAAPEIVQIDSGDYFTCALDAEGAVWCWGLNSSGQLGDGTLTDRNFAARVPGLPRSRAIAVGGSHVCAVGLGRRVRCWGGNWSGQLGNGETADAQPTPVSVLDLYNIAVITAGGSHSCAIDRNRRAFCWGENSDGQLGNGSTESITVRTRIPTPARFSTIAAGDETTCGITPRGVEACWGRNASGQVGDGTEDQRTVPTQIARNNLDGLSPGAFHSCGLNPRGQAFCWGSNQWGNLGNGGFEQSLTPTPVSGLSNLAQITTGRRHSCAITTSGRASCWGENEDGQLGDATLTDRSLPVRVFGSRLRFTAISAGTSHSCALRRDARVLCWGNNEFGQLGNRRNETMSRPVLVRFP